MPREDLVFFASKTPIRGFFSMIGFDEESKWVERVEQDLHPLYGRSKSDLQGRRGPVRST